MRAPSSVAWGAALLLVCALGFTLRWSKASRLDGPESFKAASRIDYYEFGRSLREIGVLGWSGWPSAFRGPVYPALLSAVESYRADTHPRAPAMDALTGLFETSVAAGTALQLFSPPAALAAAALAAFHPGMSSPLPGSRIEAVFGLLVCLVMLALIDWSRAPTWRATLLLACAIGVSILCRAVLFAFPLVLAGAVMASWLPAPGRGKLWALVLVPYLLLAPWVLRNAVQFGRFIPFDDHAATRNLFAATVGVIENAPGSYQDILAIEADPHGTPAATPELRMLALARRNILASPLTYAGSCLRRLAFVLRLHPWLLLLALAGALRRRAAAGSRALALLCLYYILAHIPMTMEARYMEPLLPLLIVLAAGLFADLPGPSFSASQSRAGKWAAFVASGLCLGGLYALSCERLAAEVLLTSVPCRLPQTALTDYHCAARLLAQDRRDEALARYRLALSSLPADPDATPLLRSKIEGGLILAGDPATLLAMGPGCMGTAPRRHPEEVHGVALQLQDSGRTADAIRLYDTLLACHPDDVLFLSDRGVAQALAGREDLAMKDLRRALRRAPGDARASYNLGILLERRGRSEEALAVYEKARDVFRTLDRTTAAKGPFSFLGMITLRIRELAGHPPAEAQRATTFKKTAAKGGS